MPKWLYPLYLTGRNNTGAVGTSFLLTWGFVGTEAIDPQWPPGPNTTFPEH